MRYIGQSFPVRIIYIYSTLQGRGDVGIVIPVSISWIHWSLKLVVWWRCSAAAFFVVTTLRNLARDGRTIIASIHQPSSEVFELFDNLTLLSSGKLVYFGEASAAIEVPINIR